MGTPFRVLFVCTGNSARSQMAEGFGRHYGPGRVEAHSAGMAPTRVNPYAARVMQEKGIDIAGQQSKAFDGDLARQMDVVVTVCGRQRKLPDPSARSDPAHLATGGPSGDDGHGDRDPREVPREPGCPRDAHRGLAARAGTVSAGVKLWKR